MCVAKACRPSDGSVVRCVLDGRDAAMAARRVRVRAAGQVGLPRRAFVGVDGRHASVRACASGRALARDWSGSMPGVDCVRLLMGRLWRVGACCV